MTGLPFGLIVEGMVSVLLAVTIIYCLVVNRKLNALRSDQAKLREVVQALDRSTRNAENIIGELRETAALTQEELDERIDYARSTLSRLTTVVAEANALMMRMGETPVPVAPKEYSSTNEESTTSAVAVPEIRKPVKTQMRLSNLMRGQPRKAPAAKSDVTNDASAKGTA